MVYMVYCLNLVLFGPIIIIIIIIIIIVLVVIIITIIVIIIVKRYKISKKELITFPQSIKTIKPIHHKYLLTLTDPNTNKYITKLTIAITQIIWQIWQSTNNNKYDKKLLIPQQTIVNKINAQLKTIIPAHYKKHKLNDTLDTFQDQFCINET